MIYVLAGCVIALLILILIQMFKTRRLVLALASTNKALNETRELVAKHEKSIKSLTKFIEKL